MAKRLFFIRLIKCSRLRSKREGEEVAAATKKIEKEETDPILWYKTPDFNSFEEV